MVTERMISGYDRVDLGGCAFARKATLTGARER